MKAFLLYKDQDFNLEQPLPSNEPALRQDLELNTLFQAMAQGDKYILNIVEKVVLAGTQDLDTLRYRQDILKDCLKNPAIVWQIYQIPIESIESRQRHWMGVFSNYPTGILSGSVELMGLFVSLLHKLKQIADEHAGAFESEGFKRFFAMIQKELDDDYFASVQDHLARLKFEDGVLLSAELGEGNEGKNYVLRKAPDKQPWLKRVFAQQPASYTFSIHPRDDAGARALEDLRNRGINLVANALAQSTDHIDSFFKLLRVELAFYMGCLNLSEQLTQLGAAVSFPQPAALDERKLAFSGLYDICLALTMKQKVVGNEISADGKDLFIITGANQGGKSTALRSIGLAQLMMQCGMFVPAQAFSANLCSGIFTHYKRKEDASMKSGKLDEELSRMSEIVDKIKPNAMMLFNESFAATNEREGSEIARQITNALLERRIKVFFVTHQYEFAHGFYARKMDNALFLRAGRQTGGGRTFKLTEGEPLQTSYGEDLYHKVFGTESSEKRIPA
jgi:DNA mismatch repair ATPase MutS